MRALISLEFIIGVTILILIHVAVLASFSGLATEEFLQNEKGAQICYTTSVAVGSADVGGNGFSMNISLPQTLGASNTTPSIVINNTFVDVSWDPGGFASCTITTQNITSLTMYSGKFSLNNINSTIYVSSLFTDKLLYDLGEEVVSNGTHYLNNVSVTLLLEGATVLGYPVTLETTGQSFEYDFTPASTGHYLLKVNDINITAFYAEREFEVV